MRYLKKREFGDRVGIAVRTVDRSIAQRLIISRTLKTGGVRIPESEVERCFKPNIQQFLDKGEPP